MSLLIASKRTDNRTQWGVHTFAPLSPKFAL